MTAKDCNKLDKLVKRASFVVVGTLDSVGAVVERCIRTKVQAKIRIESNFEEMLTFATCLVGRSFEKHVKSRQQMRQTEDNSTEETSLCLKTASSPLSQIHIWTRSLCIF